MSRPMTPGEQFDRINTHQKWERGVAGVPDERDLKVSGFVCIQSLIFPT